MLQKVIILQYFFVFSSISCFTIFISKVNKLLCSSVLSALSSVNAYLVDVNYGDVKNNVFFITRHEESMKHMCFQ